MRKYTRRLIRSCLLCGKETKNKKYCSPKCNAQANNNIQKFWLNGGKPWRIGLTKETSPSIVKATKTASKTRIERKIPAWNKNLTKETDERVRKYGASISKSRKEGFRTGRIIPWHTGQTKETNESIARAGRNISKAMKGKTPWNAGLTKEMDDRLNYPPSVAENLLFHAKQPKSEKFKQGRREYMLSHPKTETHLKNLLKSIKNRVIPVPNSQEILLNTILEEHFLGQWKFVGDGKAIIGGKCPDFINTDGRKDVIELFGDYWHKNDNPQNRIEHFKKYGYSTLIIWEHELKDKNKTIERVREWQKSLMSSTLC